MNNLTDYYIKELGSSFSQHLKNWGDKTDYTEIELIESLVLWTEIKRLNVNFSLCDQIVNAVDSNTDLAWDSSTLTLHDKAYIIQQLTYKNFNLVYYDKLSPFPSHTKDLLSLLVKSQVTLNSNLKDRILIKYRQYNDVVNNLFNKYKRLGTIILLIIGFCTFDNHLLWPALLFSWIIWLLVFLHHHDCWTHKYIKPKNKFISEFLRLLCFLWGGISNNHDNAVLHMKHHIYWKDKVRDPEQYTMSKGIFKYYILGMGPGFVFAPEDVYQGNISFMQKYHNQLVILFCLSFLLTFGIEVFFYFYIMTRSLVWAVPTIPHLFQHGFIEKAEDEFNFILLTPLLGIGGVHITHHNSRRAIYGTEKYPWVKWFNPHFYIYKLLYNDTSKV